MYFALDYIANKQKSDSIYDNNPEEKNPMEGKNVIFVENKNDKENADGVCGHLEAIDDKIIEETIYDKYIKRAIDKALAFGGLIVLSPVFLIIALLIKLEDPGPVLFTQKRVGQNKRYFKLHKFRSMRMDTPHDVPTHMLSNPDQYITKVGKFIRDHSLDELPQIWDIFIGNMSVIGPRPGLWNQDKLTALRDQYDANDIKPGLTGWAQINGRDELELEDKAKLDGEYAKNRGPRMDAKCFLGSLYVFGNDESVVEGGTGEINKELTPDFEDVQTFPKKKKNILITGANSYIGESVKEYLIDADSDNYNVNIIDTIGLKPTPSIFKGYDVVFNVTGIAHIKETDENKHLYYEINRDLSISIAKAAKEAGVKQFVLLSSMSVYGLSTGYITKSTKPSPISAYGISKYQADKEIVKLNDENFKVVILRPPMVYGKGCKGNYQLLRSFALKSPIFPDYKNKRSMIFIGNLCEFVKKSIDCDYTGLFFPQNADYANTSKLVYLISINNGKNVVLTKVFNCGLKLLNLKVLKKVFGNLMYEPTDREGKYGFEESVKLTEQ